jgi:hypothetical protein
MSAEGSTSISTSSKVVCIEAATVAAAIAGGSAVFPVAIVAVVRGAFLVALKSATNGAALAAL